MCIFSFLLFSDDVISLASSSIIAGDEEGQDDELRAAASHLCSTICGEDGGDNEQERDGEKVSLTKRPSLALLPGALPTAASLGLPESITKMGEEKENGRSMIFIFTLHNCLMRFNSTVTFYYNFFFFFAVKTLTRYKQRISNGIGMTFVKH